MMNAITTRTLKRAGAKRGDRIRFVGNVEGLYVGTSHAGVEWVAYDEAKFEAMCKRFDEHKDRRVRRVRISPAAYDAIEDIFSLWESDTERFTLRKTYIEARSDDLDMLAEYISTTADDAGQLAMDCVKRDHEGQREFAYRAAYVGRKRLAMRLRGQKATRVDCTRLWKEAAE